MKFDEAKATVDRYNRTNSQSSLMAKVVRILPENVDPPIEGDNGWDVEITVIRDFEE